MSDLGVLYQRLDQVLHEILAATGHTPDHDAIYHRDLIYRYERVTPDGQVRACAARLPLRLERESGQTP